MQCLIQQAQKKQLAISTSPRDCISVEINCYFNLVFFALPNPDELKKHLQRWMYAIGPQIGHIMFNCTSGWLVFPRGGDRKQNHSHEASSKYSH